jgi:hypothetical protein
MEEKLSPLGEGFSSIFFAARVQGQTKKVTRGIHLTT